MARDLLHAFRKHEFEHEYMLAWWSLIDRNMPQLANAIRSDQNLVKPAESLFNLVAQLRDRHTPIANEHFDDAERILRRLHAAGGRRVRLDASRMPSLVEHLRGNTVEEVIGLVASVSPNRNPRPTKDISHLIRAEARIPGVESFDNRMATQSDTEMSSWIKGLPRWARSEYSNLSCKGEER
jgi:hypothetical protein